MHLTVHFFSIKMIGFMDNMVLVFVCIRDAELYKLSIAIAISLEGR